MALSGDGRTLALDISYIEIAKFSNKRLNSIIDCGRYRENDVINCKLILSTRRVEALEIYITNQEERNDKT